MVGSLRLLRALVGLALLPVGAALLGCTGKASPASCSDAGADADSDSDGLASPGFDPEECTDGEARVDSALRAVDSLWRAVSESTQAIEVETRALCELLGAGDCDGDLATVVANVNASLSTRFSAASELVVRLRPSRCVANAATAREITARCESLDPGAVELRCDGRCAGACSGTCTGALSCAVRSPGVSCAGVCEGACGLDVAAACDDICRGACDGTCSLTDPDGVCAGRCDGNCSGVCEIAVASSCSGSCDGTCFIEQGSASCNAESRCHGACDAACDGDCEGSVTPTSASVECATGATAQSVADATCTAPDLEVELSFGPGPSDSRAALTAALAGIKTRLPTIVAALAKLGLLLENLVPLVEVVAGVGSGYGEVLSPRELLCLAERLPEVASIIEEATADGTATLSAAVALIACATNLDCG